MSLLEIENLKTYYETAEGPVQAVDGVDLSIEPQDTIGLVGESGSGKTTIAKSLIRLLPDNGRIAGGSMKYQGRDIVSMSDRELRSQIRWQEISMIPQNAMNAFDPVYTVGEQIIEVIRVHEDGTTKKEARERARTMFDKLGLEADRVEDYPHQFSGGMAQRAAVALALALDPALLIADEPTTALDVVIQDRILNLIKDMQDEIGSAMILITHDMSVVSETCDKIAVVYGGRIVEFADTETIIKNPRHPYTLGLRNSFPDITEDSQELISIPGTPPNLIEADEGCRFASRCPFAEEDCYETTPEAKIYDDNHAVECLRADERDLLQAESANKRTWRS